jgi:heterodisulfide reductase subunit A
LVEVGRHTNINLITLADVQSIDGEPGNFTAQILKHPRYVDEEKCVGCGLCAAKCPKKVPDAFNMGLDRRKAIYVPFAQTVPLTYAIDRDECFYLQAVASGRKGKFKRCKKYCENDAIDFEQTEKLIDLKVGAIILALGSKTFDPSQFSAYQYTHFKNVVTSMEFERILSATGPTEGKLLRPSDKREPKSIGWIQCVGSRDVKHCDHGYCSSVCCMYAIKEAMVAVEHAPGPVETTIFYMDMRTYGKDFEKYYNRARDEIGVRFVRCRVHSVIENEDQSLSIAYASEHGEPHREDFDMLVLSVGIEAATRAIDLAGKLGIALDRHGFARTSDLTPVATSRPGIYVAGCFQGPKDIPYSVMEASAAAAAASRDLAPVRGALHKVEAFPPEKDVSGEEPRIGVFVCNCGINIGSVVNVADVARFSETLPYVTYAQENLFSCSQDAQEKMAAVIREQELNRVVVAACSPRTHEELFQETMAKAGLNKYLFEMANIRDQDSWVHGSSPEAATKKAKDLIAMAVAKVAKKEALEAMEVPLTQSAMIIGGGPAGMTAALTIADQGFKVHLVEREDRLGGLGLNMRKTFSGEPIKPFLEERVRRIVEHERIELHLGAEPDEVDGFVGNFHTRLSTGVAFDHGAIIIATGAEPVEVDEYLYGHNPNVMRWFDLDKKIEDDPDSIKKAACAIAIHCVGSRDQDRPYCSKICCTHAIQSAIDLKDLNPDLDVYMLYRDIRTYGRLEALYQQARSLGIVFVRYNLDNKPQVEEVEGGLQVTVMDHVLQRPIILKPDFITLYTAIATQGSERISDMLKVPLNEEKFFPEAHMKLRPVDLTTEGIFLCGFAHYPKPLDECITQAQAAASRAVRVLAQDKVVIEPTVAAFVDRDACRGCGLCVSLCPYGALALEETPEGRKVKLIPALCKGGGICAATCYRHAITINSFNDDQLEAQMHAFLNG